MGNQIEPRPDAVSTITVDGVRAAGLRPSATAVARAREAGGGFLLLIPLDSVMVMEAMGPAGTPFVLTVAEPYPTMEAALEMCGIAGRSSGFFGIAEVTADAVNVTYTTL